MFDTWQWRKVITGRSSASESQCCIPLRREHTGPAEREEVFKSRSGTHCTWPFRREPDKEWTENGRVRTEP